MPELSNIGIISAFAAGLISFLSPCVLPLVPGYISYIAGGASLSTRTEAIRVGRLSSLGFSLCFVLGFTTVFVLLGASATALGQVLLGYRFEMNLIGGGIVILFGLFMLGTLRPAWMMREARFHLDLPGGRVVSAYTLGLAFALLIVYSVGLGVPFLLAALLTESLSVRLKSIGRFGRYLRAAAALIMIAMGVAMMTGYMSAFAFWLLETFPLLGRIG